MRLRALLLNLWATWNGCLEMVKKGKVIFNYVICTDLANPRSISYIDWMGGQSRFAGLMLVTEHWHNIHCTTARSMIKLKPAAHGRYPWSAVSEVCKPCKLGTIWETKSQSAVCLIRIYGVGVEVVSRSIWVVLRGDWWSRKRVWRDDRA